MTHSTPGADRGGDDPDAPEGGTRSDVSGQAGEVIQARDIHGGVHLHGPAEEPPRHVPRELPSGTRRFVNRLPELERLDQLVTGEAGDPVQLLILTGTAGVGKTSLAVRWAHHVQERFPDGQLYANLRGYDPGSPVLPEQVLERFLRSLRVPPSSVPADPEEMAAMFRSLVAGRRMLLLLDNAATAAQVRPLLPGTRTSLTVVTSRSSLSGLAVREGAPRLTLEVFSPSEAVNLLREVTADHRERDAPEELVELAGLCARLPLALRIAAERAVGRPRMRLADLIADLRDESSLWEALSTEDDGESEAVRTVFAWSYRALPPDVARLFRLLGLHPGPDFSDHAAAALAGVTARQARRMLDTLVGAHLMEQTAFDRYEFHDLLRAYAAGQAQREEDAEECRRTLRRLLCWYLHSVAAAQTRLEPKHPRVALEPLDADVEPLAFDSHTEALRWYESERGNLVAATRAAARTGLHRIAWQLAAVLSRIYARRNPFADWLTTSHLGLDAARADGDRSAEADLRSSLGKAYTQSQRLDEGAEHHQAALALYRDLGDRVGEAMALNGLGLLARRRRHLAEALACHEQAADLLHELGDTYRTAVVGSNLASVYAELDRLPEATRRVREALEVFRSLGEDFSAGNALRILSIIHRASGRADEAVDSAREAVELARDREYPMAEGYWLIELGHAERADGRPDDALISYHRAATLQRRLGDHTREALAWDGTGLAYQQLQRPHDAVPFHRLAANIHRDHADHWHLAQTLDHLATALHEAAEPDTPDAEDTPHAGDDTPHDDEARRHWHEALTALTAYDDPQATHLRERITTALGAPANDPDRPE